MDFVRAALANGILEGMTLDDLMECAIHAESCDDWEEAVNLLSQTMPQQTCVVSMIVIK